MLPATDHTQAYLTVAGTLGGVAITGFFAALHSRRQRQAEDARQERQLRHDRALMEDAALRGSLAELLAADEAVYRNCVEVAIAVRVATSQREQPPSEAVITPVQARGRLWDAIEQYNTAGSAVRIILGDDNPVAEAMTEIDGVHTRMFEKAYAGDAEGVNAVNKDRQAGIAGFVAAAIEVGAPKG